MVGGLFVCKFNKSILYGGYAIGDLLVFLQSEEVLPLQKVIVNGVSQNHK